MVITIYHLVKKNYSLMVNSGGSAKYKFLQLVDRTINWEKHNNHRMLFRSVHCAKLIL